jgi:hypothetical protein
MRILRTKPSWAERRPDVVALLAEAFPATAFTVAGPDAAPSIAWTDGPAEGSVSTALGDVAGWQVMSGALGGDPPSGTTPLWLHRTLSVRALANGVVRYQASGVRPFDGDDPKARERLWAILEEDDPADSGYPLTDAMAEMLLAAVDPHGPEPTASALSLKLQELGYDSLWARAWATVQL